MQEGNEYPLSKGVSHALGALAAAQLVLGGAAGACANASYTIILFYITCPQFLGIVQNICWRLTRHRTPS